jgi:hypothetical protein
MPVMTLSFPNPSRSFDDEQNVVRFSGHDGMSQVRFLVEAAALEKSGAELRGTAPSEAKCLAAFDSMRTSIYDAARKAYSHRRRDFYTLTTADFR